MLPFVVDHFNFALDDCILYVKLNFTAFCQKKFFFLLLFAKKVFVQKLSEQKICNELHSKLYRACGISELISRKAVSLQM